MSELKNDLVIKSIEKGKSRTTTGMDDAAGRQIFARLH